MTARRLGPRGRAFWRAVQARYELEPAEQELLLEVCRVLDLIEVLQASITPGKADAETKLPLGMVRELRASRVLLQRLLSQLALPNSAGEAPLSMASQRARRAANRRWELDRGRHAAS